MSVIRIKSLTYAVLIHVFSLLVVTLTFNVSSSETPFLFNPEEEIIQGLLINETDLNAERERIAYEREQVRLEQERIEAERIATERRLEAERIAEQQRIESERLAEIERQERIQRETIERAQLQERQQREADARQRAAEAERIRLAEEARARAAEEERIRQAEQARQEAEARALAQRESLENQRRLSQIEQEKAYWVRLIQARIEQAWVAPGNTSNVRCRLLVTQIPSGDVVDVRMIECNGNDTLLRSVESAVYRASPLPQPRIPGVFERLLELDFIIEN